MEKKYVLIGLIIFLLGAGVSLFLFFTSKQKLTYSLKQLENKSALIPLAIIGSGPAGLSAALYGVRQGIHTVLFEGPKPGGQLTETGLVENWPGVGREKGPVIMKNMCEYVGSLGAFLVPEVITSLDVSQWPYRIITDDGQEFYALSIIVATGSAPRVLHVPGEHEYWGKGVTTCALCDAPYYKNKDVVVVGGGDSACEQVLQLAPYARTITMLVRSEHVRASLTMQHQVRAVPKARVLFNKEVKQIQGDSTHTTAVLVFDKQTGTMAPIPAHGIFLAIGHEPRTALVAGKVALRPDGSIKLKSCTQETSVAGIFAAGDVEDMMYRQAGVAAGAGIKAAIDAVKFLYACGWTVLSAQRFDAQLYKPARVVRISDDQLAVKHLESLDAFKQYVLTAQKPVIIDFYAQHCPACMHMLPLYEMVARQFADKILFYKVDTVGVPELEAHLKVERIPCFIVFNKGVQVARYYSVMSKPEMLTFVQQFAV